MGCKIVYQTDFIWLDVEIQSNRCKSSALLSVSLLGSLMGDPVVMLSFYPEFPAAVTSSLTTCGEFIFVVDRSGSMDCRMHSGNDAKMRIESARVS